MPPTTAPNFWQVLSLIGTLTITILQFFYYRRLTARLQIRDLGKANALGDVYFLYEATPKVYSANGKKFLEIEVKVTNKSSKKLAILAMFVRFRPILNSNDSSVQNIKFFDDLGNFEDGELEARCSLTQFRNIAFAKDFVWQTSVEGVSVRRSFDLVEEDFCKKYPLVMAQIMIMGGSLDYIDKTHFPKYSIGPLRMPWVDYVARKQSECYNFFSRMGKEGYQKGGWSCKYLDRILVNKDGSLDVDNSFQFEKLLQSVINSNIENVVDLRSE